MGIDVEGKEVISGHEILFIRPQFRVITEYECEHESSYEIAYVKRLNVSHEVYGELVASGLIVGASMDEGYVRYNPRLKPRVIEKSCRKKKYSYESCIKRLKSVSESIENEKTDSRFDVSCGMFIKDTVTNDLCIAKNDEYIEDGAIINCKTQIEKSPGRGTYRLLDDLEFEELKVSLLSGKMEVIRHLPTDTEETYCRLRHICRLRDVGNSTLVEQEEEMLKASAELFVNEGIPYKRCSSKRVCMELTPDTDIETVGAIIDGMKYLRIQENLDRY